MPPIPPIAQLPYDRPMLGGATFDSTGAYRFHLWREWDNSSATVTFVMLNPSTANAEQDDPTIRRCISFARDWGYGRLEVVNLFACRATSPRELAAAAAPFGTDNEYWLRRAAESSQVVFAWGNAALSLREPPLDDWLRGGHTRWCLGLTALGEPRHPLYVRSQTPLVPCTVQSPSR